MILEIPTDIFSILKFISELLISKDTPNKNNNTKDTYPHNIFALLVSSRIRQEFLKSFSKLLGSIKVNKIIPNMELRVRIVFISLVKEKDIRLDRYIITKIDNMGIITKAII